MTEVSVEALFDEFALAYRRGERPDVLAYLERLPEGPERDDLADLIDRFLQAVPARAPAEEEIVLLAARQAGEPGLLALRLRRKLSREAVVEALLRALGLSPQARDKVASYYHELETGLLDPRRVDRRVWDALSDIRRANARALAGLLGARPAAEPLYRREGGAVGIDVLEVSLLAPPPAPEEPDEVDRLFTGAS